MINDEFEYHFKVSRSSLKFDKKSIWRRKLVSLMDKIISVVREKWKIYNGR